MGFKTSETVTLELLFLFFKTVFFVLPTITAWEYKVITATAADSQPTNNYSNCRVQLPRNNFSQSNLHLGFVVQNQMCFMKTHQVSELSVNS